MKNLLFILYFVLFNVIIACTSKNTKENETNVKQIVEKKEDSIKKNLGSFTESVYNIATYDNNRILETGSCFQITKNIIVAPFSFFSGSTKAIIAPINGGRSVTVTEFYIFDRINNLILLYVDSLDTNPLKLYGGSLNNGLKTFVLGKKQSNTQPIYPGTFLQEKIIQGRKLYNISNVIGNRKKGSPVLVSNGSVLGMGFSEEVANELNYFAVPSNEILHLMKNIKEVKKISTIGSSNVQRNSKIKQIVLKKEYVNISIKLYNETQAYRDNFIQLAEEGFYDSLLIHRVIRDFGIQMGAADSRHAAVDDVVGWKGPGYTIPAHVIPGFFHKRGAIGSPRKPDSKNKERRSDGSQFYIVTGRKYLDRELDELEEQNKIKFTNEQRETYKTIGGSPHLDGSYTVFGEVVSGLEIADRISLFPVMGDFRPIKDIRLNEVEIIF